MLGDAGIECVSGETFFSTEQAKISRRHNQMQKSRHRTNGTIAIFHLYRFRCFHFKFYCAAMAAALVDHCCFLTENSSLMGITSTTALFIVNEISSNLYSVKSGGKVKLKSSVLLQKQAAVKPEGDTVFTASVIPLLFANISGFCATSPQDKFVVIVAKNRLPLFEYLLCDGAGSVPEHVCCSNLSLNNSLKLFGFFILLLQPVSTKNNAINNAEVFMLRLIRLLPLPNAWLFMFCALSMIVLSLKISFVVYLIEIAPGLSGIILYPSVRILKNFTPNCLALSFNFFPCCDSVLHPA